MNTFYACTKKVRVKPQPQAFIIDFIPTGRENAIHRNVLLQLCFQSGLGDGKAKDPDRCMRELIRKARMDYVILNLMAKKLYEDYVHGRMEEAAD